MSNRTFIIAEAGANHNRDFQQAIALIDVAVEAGADAVKFQTYSSNTLYSKNVPDFAGYKNINKLIEDIQLPRDWQPKLKDYCDQVDIEFMSTPFDEQAVEELCSIGVKRLKIAGFESTDPRFVKMVASAQLPLIISAGIGSNLNSIQNIIDWVAEVQVEPDITILHCNNAYPTPDTDIFLNRVDSILRRYPIKAGLSDHTRGILAPCLAVAKGATCIEKHFTLSNKLPGPDHPFALEPQALKQMVDKIRLSEKMCNDTSEQVTESEKSFKKAMRSVVLARKVSKGVTLSEDDLTTKRPLLADSVPALNFYDVIGRRVNKELDEDDILSWEDLDA